MKLNIAICDDEKSQVDFLVMLTKKWLNSKRIEATILTYNTAESFLFHYAENKNVNVLLLDIRLKELNGIELSKHIRKENDYIQIIIITGYSDFMSEGYDVSALHYLLKPVKEDMLFNTLDKALRKLSLPEDSLFLTIDREMYRIRHKEIRYIESHDHYITVNTLTDEYKAKMNLSDLQKILGDGFFRCQRSFIVNLLYVRKITRASIIMDNMTEVPLSRGLYEAANQALIKIFP